MTTYLDCNATTPIEPAVAELVRHYMEVEFGNSGSRTHVFGLSAKAAIEKARQQIADVVNVEKDEPLKLELASFIECAAAGAVPEVSGQQGAAALDLALEITNQINNASKQNSGA